MSNGASIQNEGLIKEISGGSYTYNPTIFQEGALQNSGTINDITNNAKFSGAPAIKNEGSGKITITDAEVLGSVDGLTAGFAIYGYAVTPSATGMVTINGGNYSCAVYDPNNTSAAEKLFPDGATGIIINSGNFEHSPSANLLAPNKAIVNSGNTNFPYTVGEPGYTVQKRLKEAQELSDLKDENMALEYELNRQKDLMARLMQRVEAALTFLEEKLPEQFRPYVQRARAHILPEQKQEHRRDRGMSMGGMER